MTLLEEQGAPTTAVLRPASRTPGENNRHKFRRHWTTWLLLVLLAWLAVTSCMLNWGGYLLIANDKLAPHADGAVVLQGSFLGERVRLAGAVRLLQLGTVDRILLGVPEESYWGQRISPVVRGYIEKTYGEDVANRTDFCELGGDVDSTEQEAEVMAECVGKQSWRSFVLVTSDYHTRRAGIIWRRTLRQKNLGLQMLVHGVAGPEFQTAGWWRKRRYAKTWLFEFTKLVWTLISR